MQYSVVAPNQTVELLRSITTLVKTWNSRLSNDAGCTIRYRFSHPVWSFTQRGLALVALTAALPLLAVLYVLVRTTSKGPFLFKQERAGLGGRPFSILKIRTMKAGSEQSTALGVARANASITPVGRILRDLKLDELPQLWNVVCGEMEIVGPRPLPMTLHNEMRASIEGFDDRTHVKPGITSISQVCIEDNAVNGKQAADWGRRLRGERHYVRTKCFVYDSLTVALTGLYVSRRVVTAVALHLGLAERAPLAGTPSSTTTESPSTDATGTNDWSLILPDEILISQPTENPTSLDKSASGMPTSKTIMASTETKTLFRTCEFSRNKRHKRAMTNAEQSATVAPIGSDEQTTANTAE